MEGVSTRTDKKLIEFKKAFLRKGYKNYNKFSHFCANKLTKEVTRHEHFLNFSNFDITVDSVY